MKRIASIAFLAIILFNFYGYRLVISCMQSNSDSYLEKQVDQNNFNEQDLVTIKTKLNLPYYVSSDEFERDYGSITINGKCYQYVKRRVHNDTLELLCLPNQTKNSLQSVSNELTKSLAEGQTTTPKKNTTIKITLPDFFQAFNTFSATCFLKRKPAFTQHTYLLTEGCTLKQRKPPKHTLLISC